jgi:hypothetical protein
MGGIQMVGAVVRISIIEATAGGSLSRQCEVKICPPIRIVPGHYPTAVLLNDGSDQ